MVVESKDKNMLQRFSYDEQQVKIPNQQSADRFPREESMDLFLDSGMVNLLLETNGEETEGVISLEGNYSVIY